MSTGTTIILPLFIKEDILICYYWKYVLSGCIYSLAKVAALLCCGHQGEPPARGVSVPHCSAMSPLSTRCSPSSALKPMVAANTVLQFSFLFRGAPARPASLPSSQIVTSRAHCLVKELRTLG